MMDNTKKKDKRGGCDVQWSDMLWKDAVEGRIKVTDSGMPRHTTKITA